MGLFSELHIAWLAARIRELATTPIDPGNPSSMMIRDAVARKFARDLLTDDPDLDAERFLELAGREVGALCVFLHTTRGIAKRG